MVRTSLAIEREVDDTHSIRDMGAGTKRKENQSSSSEEDLYSMRISETGPPLSGSRSSQVFYPTRTDDMLLLPSTKTYEAGLPSEAGSPEL